MQINLAKICLAGSQRGSGKEMENSNGKLSKENFEIGQVSTMVFYDGSDICFIACSENRHRCHGRAFSACVVNIIFKPILFQVQYRMRFVEVKSV